MGWLQLIRVQLRTKFRTYNQLSMEHGIRRTKNDKPCHGLVGISTSVFFRDERSQNYEKWHARFVPCNGTMTLTMPYHASTPQVAV